MKYVEIYLEILCGVELAVVCYSEVTGGLF